MRSVLKMAAKRRHQSSTAPENGRQKQSLQSSGSSKKPRRHGKENGHTCEDNTTSEQTWSKGYIALVAALAVVAGVLHRNHIANMFESDRHFSHLSTLERELSFRTEMGLYYSYFKTMVEAPTVTTGLYDIMYDNRTEYPKSINTLKRFNLYPEVLLGVAYRAYAYVTAKLEIQTKQCWRVDRGEMSPVLSCIGLGEMPYFYIESVFLLNGINMAIFFLFGTFLSGSILGGCMAVASFFFNHGECTRVQWTPPLRESFAYPFFVMEMFIVVYILRIRQPTFRHAMLLAVATVCFMLPWQFAQFALMTQTVAVFGTYVLLFIGSRKIKVFLLGQAIGLAISYVCLFGNEMLLTSFFAACLLSVSVIVILEPVIEKIRIRILIWAVQGILLVVGTLGIKIGSARILGVADDKHIGDILKSKFTSYKNFHTMLYTCAAEFDFMEKETPWRVLKTLLGPCAFVSIIVLAIHIMRREWRLYQQNSRDDQIDSNGNHGNLVKNGDTLRSQQSETDSSSSASSIADEQFVDTTDVQHRSKEHAELVYVAIQLVAFTLMAVLIMRLKLFWTPQMCLVTSLIASPKLFSWLGTWSYSHPRFGHTAVLAIIMGSMSIQGYANLRHQWKIQGEYSNPTLESLIEWINANTPKDAVFAGPMPTMATVKLCTQRNIINHPHYEDVELRARTKKVYTMYSRKPAEEVWRNLMDLHVEYVILEEAWCVRRSRPGCGMAEIWDLEDEKNRHVVVPTCAKIHKNPGPYFTRVFRNSLYDILKVNRKPQKQKARR